MMHELGVLHPKPPPQDSPAHLRHLHAEKVGDSTVGVCWIQARIMHVTRL